MTFAATVLTIGGTLASGADVPTTDFCFDCGSDEFSWGLPFELLLILSIIAIPGLLAGLVLHRKFPSWPVTTRVALVGVVVLAFWGFWLSRETNWRPGPWNIRLWQSMSVQGVIFAQWIELMMAAALASILSYMDALRAAKSWSDYLSND